MPRKSDSGRAVLDEAAKAALDRMLVDLKKEESCIRISPSKLVSWIVEQYAKTSFSADKSTIIKKYFDSKEYLKNIIRGAHSSEDVEAALKAVLVKVGAADEQKRPRGRSKQRANKSGDGETPFEHAPFSPKEQSGSA